MQKVQCTKAISVTSYLTWGYVPYYMLCIKLNLQFSAKQSKKMPSQDALYTRMNCNTETYSPMHQFALLMQFHRPKKCAGLDIFKSIFFFKKISLCITLLHNNEHHHLHCIAMQHVWPDNSSFMWLSHCANVFLTSWWFEESLFIHMECTREYSTLGSTLTDADKTRMREFSSSLVTNFPVHHLKPCTSNTSK